MSVTLLLVLLACAFAIQAAPLRGGHGMAGKLQQQQAEGYIEMPQEDDNAARVNELPSFERSMELYRAWEGVYGLADPAQPPARIALPPNVPRAPHLEDCSARSTFRQQTEARGPRGEAPTWSSVPSGCRYPQPPWVRGSDAANLAGTRQAQADIWLHQFPARSASAAAQAARGECVGRRLLVVPWPSRRNGIGSQIHIMSAWLNHAMSHDRILVPTPGSFERANHSHCTGAAKGSFSCYFFPLVAPSCDEAALEAIAAVAAAGPAGKGGATLMASDARILLFTESTFPPHSTALAARGGGVSVLATSPKGMGAEGMEALMGSDRRVLLSTESTFPPFPPHATVLAAREGGTAVLERRGHTEVLGWAVLTLSPAPVPNPSFPSPSPSHQAVGHSVSGEQGGHEAMRWGTAYLESRGDTEVMGRVRVENPPYLQLHWWRAQSFRFMLRWPSAYLCHLTNRARHEAYGLPVATRLVNSLLQQQNIIASLSSPSSSSPSHSLQDSANPDNLKINVSSEAAVLAALSFSPQTSLETRAWPALGFDGCSSETHVSPEIAQKLDLTPSSSSSSSSSPPLTFTPQGIVDSVYEGVGGEVYMPRPMVSVHVRQGDKAIEMELSSFASYMFLAYRLRSHTPDLQYAWLSTEMEVSGSESGRMRGGKEGRRGSESGERGRGNGGYSVVQQSRAYKDWTFFYTRNKRQTGATAMVAYEQDAGVELLVGVSFANLIIASECDYFIGPLKSNWNRLINGLRMTNGRMNRGYAALNFGGW
ncbi:unnamed protein product [Closterium sp. Naga37s-1]|nr:unnamed protein product [Closterium sp. Naga37s-1]